MSTGDVVWGAFILALVALISIVVLIVTTPDVAGDLTDRVEYLECVHRTFEDGSTIHEDAEVVRRFCPERPTP